MRTDKEQAFKLREQGKSYKEIHGELGMSVSTLSNWFRGHDFSEEMKHILTEKALKKSTAHMQSLNRIRGDLLKIHYDQAEKEALVELKENIRNPLFISAVVAYWGEGDKLTRHHVRIANTDPEMLKMFVFFLKNHGNISMNKVSLALFIYEDLDDTLCRQYWSEKVGISKFHKSQVLPSKHKTRRLPYGTCSVVLTNSYLKKKMTVWIDQLPEMVLNMVPSETS